MSRFSMFRRLRRRGFGYAQPPGYRTDKPTKGAGKHGLAGYWSARFFVSVGVLLCVVPVHAQDESAVLYPGTYQAEDWRVTKADDAKIVDADGAEFGKALQSESSIFSALGTDIIVRWKNPYLSGQVTGENVFIQFPMDTLWMRDLFHVITLFSLENGKLVVDSNALSRMGDDGWIDTIMAHSTLPQTFHIDLSEAYAGPKFTAEDGTTPPDPYPLQIDSITVLDRTFENVFPYIAAIGITLGMTLFVVGSALRERWRR